jgi:hypothetical protein
MIDTGLRQLYSMDQWEWFTVLIVVLVTGALCLRGFGSRTDY